MATDLMEYSRQGSSNLTFVDISRLENFTGSVYECRVVVVPQDSGGFSARTLRIPIVSCGDSIDEAVKNAKKEFQRALTEYVEDGKEIPDMDVIERPRNGEERWILVDVSEAMITRQEIHDMTPSNNALRDLAKKHPALPEWYDEDD